MRIYLLSPKGSACAAKEDDAKEARMTQKKHEQDNDDKPTIKHIFLSL